MPRPSHLLRASLATGLLAALPLFGCGGKKAAPRPGTPDYAEVISAFYVGTTAMESQKDDLVAPNLTRVTELAPDEPAAWGNLGLFYLSKNDLVKAGEALEKARELAPDNALIIRWLGMLADRKGDFAKAEEHLRRAAALAPENTRIQFNVAQIVSRKGGPEADTDYQKQIEAILRARPQNVKAQMYLARIAAKRGDAATLNQALEAIRPRLGDLTPEAPAYFRTLEAAAKRGDLRAAAVQSVILLNVSINAITMQQATAELEKASKDPEPPLLRPLRLAAPSPNPAAPDTGLTFAPGPARDVPLAAAAWAASVLPGREGEPPPGVVAAPPLAGAVTVAADSSRVAVGGGASFPFPGRGVAPGPHGIVPLDFNYDFRTDFALAGAGGLRLMQAAAVPGYGPFNDVTAQAKLPASLTNAAYVGAWPLDIEADGDLDLVLAPRTGPPVALQNNGDGTWARLGTFSDAPSLRDLVWADTDGDGDNDVALLDADGNLRLYANERSGLFRPRPAPAGFGTALALGVIEANGDAVLDLIALKPNGAVARIVDRNGTEFEAAEVAQGPAPAAPTPGQARLLTGDLDNNGAVDLVIAAPKSAQPFLSSAPGVFAPHGGPLPLTALSLMDAGDDGTLDLTGVGADGKPATLSGRGTRNYRWINFRPYAKLPPRDDPVNKGVGDKRINTFGVGGEFTARAGLLYQKVPVTGPRVHLGLGGNEALAVVRIVWPNGYAQGDFPAPAGDPFANNLLKAGQIVEADQRLTGSCPWLFAWDGEKMRLVTDCIWRSPLGLKINAQVTAGVSQTEDWVRIRGDQLKPRNGVYDLRITAELWETHFFDYLALMAVDHPDDSEVFVDERFVPAQQPDLSVQAFAPPRPVLRAVDDTGGDAAPTLAEWDGKYLDNFGRGEYQGVTRDHWVEVELPADAPERVSLIASGWLHPTDTSINVAIGQGRHDPPRGLSLEVPDGRGGWAVAKAGLGFPAGKIKTVVFDLRGVFRPGAPKRLRLRTNMEVFWDQIRWAEQRPDTPLKKTRMLPSRSELRFRGFSRVTQKDPSSPEMPDYHDVVSRGQAWRDLVGYHTRFGDVFPLLSQIDDRYVIMNAGDELALEFKELPPPPPGWKRDYVLIGDGWEKDGNYNTTFGQTVLPLPSHAIRDYTTPPGRLENDPVYRKHKKDWQTYHTRYVAPDGFRDALLPRLETTTKP